MSGMEKLTRPTACDYDRARCQFQDERSGLAPSNLRLAARLLLRRLPLRCGLPRGIAARLRLAGWIAPRFDLPWLLARLLASRLNLSRLVPPRLDLPRLFPRL